jgi:ABC-type lipoprotein export system ATPase subunit
MIVSIFGPQSSGKSTLLNFVLGCDFMSSAGRCTKGIYGTYLEIANKQIPNCEAILVLDTEGLFSNYKSEKF